MILKSIILSTIALLLGFLTAPMLFTLPICYILVFIALYYAIKNMVKDSMKNEIRLSILSIIYCILVLIALTSVTISTLTISNY